MSSLVNKVKDVLKPLPDNEDEYSQGGQGTHGASKLSSTTGSGTAPSTARREGRQSSMPGAFDSGTDGKGNADSAYSGSKGHGTSATTGQYNDGTGRTTQGLGSGRGMEHDRKEAAIAGRDQQGYTSNTGASTYDRATQGYGSTRGTQDTYGSGQGVTSSGRDATLGTAAAGTGAAATGAATSSSRGGYTSSHVSDHHLMDPAERSHGSNIMDRSKDDYTSTSGSGTSHANKLHKRDDPRDKYDNTGRSEEYNGDSSLRQGQTTGSSAVPVSGATTSGSGHEQGDTSGPHSSKLLNKLDPRVDSSNTTSSTDRDSSKYQNRESEKLGGTGLGAAGAGAAGATAATADSHHRHHGHSHGGTERGYNTGNYSTDTSGSQPTSTRDNYSGTSGSQGMGGPYGTTSSTLPSRTRDEYGTPIQSDSNTTGRGVERGNLARDTTGHTQSGSDPRFTAGGPTSTSTSGNTYSQNPTSTSTTGNTPSYEQGDTSGPHSSKLLNKLDPRVDNNSSSGNTGTSGYDNNRGTSGYDKTTGTSSAYNPTSTSSSNTAGASSGAGAARTHFHCMHCGHKNDASHLSDAQGNAVTGRTALHCMDCGHRNQVGHLFGQGSNPRSGTVGSAY